MTSDNKDQSAEWIECAELIKREAALLTPEELAQPWTKPKTIQQLRVVGLCIALELHHVVERYSRP